MALVEGFNETVRGSARGSLLLMTGQIVSTIVSALTIIVVARLLGPEKYGVVTVVMVHLRPEKLNKIFSDLSMALREALFPYLTTEVTDSIEHNLLPLPDPTINVTIHDNNYHEYIIEVTIPE